MLYSLSPIAVTIFAILVGLVLGLSFFLGRKAKSARGYYAAHGEIHWFVNGIAFAGDYLSAASFLGICGLIAFYGYDGFLYSIGYLAGWIVALFVIAEPIKRLGKYTFADALDSRFNSRGIKFAAAISTLVVSLFYLIPQMVGAGTLVKPLLGLPAITYAGIDIRFTIGVALVGVIVITIVVTAGMVSTTWVQFIKGSMLVFFCGIITLMLFARGFTAKDANTFPRLLSEPDFQAKVASVGTPIELSEKWKKLKHEYARFTMKDGSISTWFISGAKDTPKTYVECETVYALSGKSYVNGKEQTTENDLQPVNFVAKLPENVKPGQSLGPLSFLAAVQNSTIATDGSETVLDKVSGEDVSTSIYYPKLVAGSEIMTPGGHPTLFKGIKSEDTRDRLNFLSLMLALFCGTAALPHILIRYYTVKDQASARKSTVVGIAAIGLFYVLTLYLGLGAMTSARLDPSDYNVAAPLLAKVFGEFAFALISAIAFTTVLGTVSGLIIAASGAVAHDLLHNLFKMNLDDHAKVRAGKIVAVIVGIIAIVLGVLFRKMNVSFLVGWAFNIAASANLPAITMLLFWKGTTKQGITASILVGLLSSLTWIFLSTDAYSNLYGINTTLHPAPVPFNQPGLVTIPLAYITLIVVSLATRSSKNADVPQTVTTGA